MSAVPNAVILSNAARYVRSFGFGVSGLELGNPQSEFCNRPTFAEPMENRQ